MKEVECRMEGSGIAYLDIQRVRIPPRSLRDELRGGGHRGGLRLRLLIHWPVALLACAVLARHAAHTHRVADLLAAHQLLLLALHRLGMHEEGEAACAEQRRGGILLYLEVRG